eukprot:scaffold1864_cov106-Isochrysis_galbana.AAC.10
MRCLRPCTSPVRLFSVYSLPVQPSIRQTGDIENGRAACDDSRWRFGDAWMSMTVSFGSEAEGAARAQVCGGTELSSAIGERAWRYAALLQANVAQARQCLPSPDAAYI